MTTIFLIVSKIKDNAFILSLTFTLVYFYQTIIVISFLYFVILCLIINSRTGNLLGISLIGAIVETIPTIILYLHYKILSQIYIEIILGNNNYNNNNANNNIILNNNNPNNNNDNNNNINNDINLINGNINNLNINNFDINNFNFNNNNNNEENALLNNH